MWKHIYESQKTFFRIFFFFISNDLYVNFLYCMDTCCYRSVLIPQDTPWYHQGTQDTPGRPNMHFIHALLVNYVSLYKINVIDPKYNINYHLHNIIKVWIKQYKWCVYCWKETHQAKPQDSLKLATRYLDGDSIFKKEAFNQSNMW